MWFWISGTLSMLDCNIFPGLGQDYLATEVNMFLLPIQEGDGEDNLNKAGCRTFSSYIMPQNCHFLYCVRSILMFVWCFRVRNISALLSAPGVPRTPCLLYLGFKTPQSNTGHAPLSVVTHHSHWKKLVNDNTHWVVYKPETGHHCQITVRQTDNRKQFVLVCSTFPLVVVLCKWSMQVCITM